VRLYFDTGVFIDYLSVRGAANAMLRTTGRRGRSPAEIATDAENLLERAARRHLCATSCLTYYEVEEALYRQLASSMKGVSRTDALLIPAARWMSLQVQIVVGLFRIDVLDLTARTVRSHLQQIDLQLLGIRAADALHATTAVAWDADVIVSADEGILKLDGLLANSLGVKIRCCDTEEVLRML